MSIIVALRASRGLTREKYAGVYFPPSWGQETRRRDSIHGFCHHSVFVGNPRRSGRPTGQGLKNHSRERRLDVQDHRRRSGGAGGVCGVSGRGTGLALHGTSAAGGYARTADWEGTHGLFFIVWITRVMFLLFQGDRSRSCPWADGCGDAVAPDYVSA